MAEKEYTDDELITCLWCGGSTPHETAVGECCWHELRLRLAASNALCAELAEALGVADEALNFLARYYLPDGRDAREVVKAALAKFKEATR